VDLLREELASYYLYHATRAELLRALGNLEGARVANEHALELTTNPAEQDLLRRRISAVAP
jgi:RNA polymerase sigma-70 factor (ECF subfamily)